MRARGKEVVSVEEKRCVATTLERWERARISPAPLSRVGRSRRRRAQPGGAGGITHYSGFIVAAGQPCGGATTNARLERCATSCFRTFVTAPGRVVPRCSARTRHERSRPRPKTRQVADDGDSSFGCKKRKSIPYSLSWPRRRTLISRLAHTPGGPSNARVVTRLTPSTTHRSSRGFPDAGFPPRVTAASAAVRPYRARRPLRRRVGSSSHRQYR